MRLLPKFVLLSLIVSLAPLWWGGRRIAKETDASLRAASGKLQRSLADRTVGTVRNQLDQAVNVLAALSGSLSGGNPNNAMETAMNTFPFLSDLWTYDANGRPRAALHRVDGRTPGLRPMDWPSAQEAIRARGFYAGELDFSSAFPRLLFAVPLLNPDNTSRGVLAGRVTLYSLSDALRGLDLGAEGRVFLVDRQGRLVAHSSETNLFEKHLQAPPAWLREGEGEYASYDGTTVLGVTAGVPDSEWRVVFEQPSRVALAPAENVRRRIRLSLFGAAGFAVLLAVLLGGFIVRPLRQFRAAVRKMQGGQFDSLITFRSRDELGEIAQALRDAQPELEHRVRDSVLGRMSRLIGHDMRTPVQALRNSLDTVLNHVKEADDVAQHHFRLMYETLSWMDEFIEEILTVGRRRPPDLRPTDVNGLVKNILVKLKPPTGVVLGTEWADPSPTAAMDPQEARKGIANAIKNAFEAVGPRGRVHVAVWPDESRVHIRVSDDGPGIPPEKMGRLFDEFSTKEGGSGLGLLVIKKVMDQHGGTVSVESPPGQGTRVTLSFPIGK